MKRTNVRSAPNGIPSGLFFFSGGLFFIGCIFIKGKGILRPIYRRSKSPMYFTLIEVLFYSNSYIESD